MYVHRGKHPAHCYTTSSYYLGVGVHRDMHFLLSRCPMYSVQCTQCTLRDAGLHELWQPPGKVPLMPVTLPPFCSTIIILVLVVDSHIIIWWSTFSCVRDHFLIVLAFSLISYHRNHFLVSSFDDQLLRFIGDLSPLSYSSPISSPTLTLSPSHNFDNFDHQRVGHRPSAECT